MLGSNLGKKVDAQFMKNEYQTFLAQNHQQPKRPLTKEEKRAEFRKKGIFVAADDTEFDPTIFEKPSTISRPAVVREETKPLRWKKDEARKKTSKPHKPVENKPSPTTDATKSMEDTGKSEKDSASKTIKVVKASKNKVRTKPSKSTEAKKTTGSKQTEQSVKKPKEIEKKEKTKNPKKKREEVPDQSVKEKRDTVAITEQSVKEKRVTVAKREELPEQSVKEKRGTVAIMKPVDDDKSEKSARTARVVPVKNDVTPNEPIAVTPEEKRTLSTEPIEVKEDEKKENVVAGPIQSQEKVVEVKEDEKIVAITPEYSQEKLIEIKEDEKKENVAAGPVQSQDKITDDLTQQIVTSPRSKSPPESQHTWKEEKKDDVFAKMEDYEDKHFDMNTAQLAAIDKKMVDMARRILKTAQRDKAFEKVLSAQENELLAKFFSGKIPYDAKVLKTLDQALDKTIDFLQANKVKLDVEMQELVEKRGNLKAAMMEAMLSTPALLPQTWEKKYSELLEEAKKETNGINWFRILLCYPQQKSFGDGPEDQFGNFTRKKRHWLIGCIFGPSDSKSFLETKKEELSQGMFMDTSLIAKAKDAPSIHAEPFSRADTDHNSTRKH